MFKAYIPKHTLGIYYHITYITQVIQEYMLSVESLSNIEVHKIKGEPSFSVFLAYLFLVKVIT